MNLIFYNESNIHYLYYKKILNYKIIIYLIMVISILYLKSYMKHFIFHFYLLQIKLIIFIFLLFYSLRIFYYYYYMILINITLIFIYINILLIIKY